MPEQDISDVKPEGLESSAKPDVIESSSNSNIDPEPGDKESLEDFVKSQVDEFKTASDLEEPEKKESDSKNEPDQKKEAASDEKKEPEPEKKEDVSGEEKKEEKVEEPIPYERFKEVNDERVRLKEDLEQYKEKVSSYDSISNFCQANMITQEQFNQALNFQALLNTDPSKALEQLLPIVNDLQGFVGNKLPADLQEAVDKGEINATWAKQTAQLRAQTKFGERKVEYDRRMMAERQQKAFQTEMMNAAASWRAQKAQIDPDFKPKSKLDDVDGLFEVAGDKFLAELNRTTLDPKTGQQVYVNLCRTPQELAALQERTYQAAKLLFRPRNLKPTPKRLSSNGSSRPTIDAKKIADAKDLQEAFRMAIADPALLAEE